MEPYFKVDEFLKNSSIELRWAALLHDIGKNRQEHLRIEFDLLVMKVEQKWPKKICDRFRMSNFRKDRMSESYCQSYAIT